MSDNNTTPRGTGDKCPENPERRPALRWQIVAKLDAEYLPTSSADISAISKAAWHIGISALAHQEEGELVEILKESAKAVPDLAKFGSAVQQELPLTPSKLTVQARLKQVALANGLSTGPKAIARLRFAAQTIGIRVIKSMSRDALKKHLPKSKRK